MPGETTLYFCYQSILDPLTQTQVVAYLEGLACAGYRVVLLTFEPRALSASKTGQWRAQMNQRGIAWYWTRYHKRPSLPATLWDITAGVLVGWRLQRKHKATILHARAHIPGLMALVVKRLTGTRLIFDVRGFKAEEQVDAGLWPAGGLLFRMMKGAERALVHGADGIVVLTKKAHELLCLWYFSEIQGKPIIVIPCCVDLRHARPADLAVPGSDVITLVYVGKVGGWYMTDEMLNFLEVAVRENPNVRWQIWTQSESAKLKEQILSRGLDDRVTIGQLPPHELLSALSHADAGFCLVRPSLSKLSSSPTKVGEYLGAGVPVISTAGIGDLDELLTGSAEAPVGVVVRDFSRVGLVRAYSELVRLMQEPDIKERCRRVAREQLDLQHVGWTRYRELYETVLATASGNSG